MMHFPKDVGVFKSTRFPVVLSLCDATAMVRTVTPHPDQVSCPDCLEILQRNAPRRLPAPPPVPEPAPEVEVAPEGVDGVESEESDGVEPEEPEETSGVVPSSGSTSAGSEDRDSLSGVMAMIQPLLEDVAPLPEGAVLEMTPHLPLEIASKLDLLSLAARIGQSRWPGVPVDLIQNRLMSFFWQIFQAGRASASEIQKASSLQDLERRCVALELQVALLVNRLPHSDEASERGAGESGPEAEHPEPAAVDAGAQESAVEPVSVQLVPGAHARSDAASAPVEPSGSGRRRK